MAVKRALLEDLLMQEVGSRYTFLLHEVYRAIPA